jgi:hypothetical protein
MIRNLRAQRAEPWVSLQPREETPSSSSEIFFSLPTRLHGLCKAAVLDDTSDHPSLPIKAGNPEKGLPF